MTVQPMENIEIDELPYFVQNRYFGNIPCPNTQI